MDLHGRSVYFRVNMEDGFLRFFGGKKIRVEIFSLDTPGSYPLNTTRKKSRWS